MNLLLMGAPGSGKGTQAKLLDREMGLHQISTGDILRDAKRKGEELGQRAKQYMDAGQLVPDDLIVDLIRSVLGQEDGGRGWVLDGFPRTMPQAQALDAMLVETHRKISKVLFIDVPEQALLSRITGRRSCRECGSVYHVVFSPPKVDGRCDREGSVLYQREDDTEDKVRVRLEAYQAQTKEVIPYYSKQGLVATIDGERKPTDVFADIRRTLEGLS